MKKLLLLFISFISLIYITNFDKLSYFGKVTVYTENFSDGKFYQTTYDRIDYYVDKGGESVVFSKAEFDLPSIIEKYNLKAVRTEIIGESVINYYSYPFAKYRQKIGGKVVNMAIAVSNDSVVVGIPIIYGSF